MSLLCLRFDIDTFSARPEYVAEIGWGCYPYIQRLMDWAKDFDVPLQFCTCGMGLREFPKEHQAIREAGHAIDSHLYTHQVQLIDEHDRIEEELIQAEQAFAEHGLPWTGIGATGMYPNGINDRPDVQQLLRGRGYQWCSSWYNLAQDLAVDQMQPYWLLPPGSSETDEVASGTGLLEIPCQGMSDRHYFYDVDAPAQGFADKTVAWLAEAAEKDLVYVPCLHPGVLAKFDPDGVFVPAVLNAAKRLGTKVVTLGEIRKRWGEKDLVTQQGG